jgi:hypothetical protein
MRRLGIVVSLIVISLVALLFVEAGVTYVKVYLLVGDNQVVLINHAAETISHGELRAFDQRYTFQRVAVGETASIAFPTRREGGYSIDVVFQSGRKLSSPELGYLTPGMAMSGLVEIQDDKVVLVESKVIPDS